MQLQSWHAWALPELRCATRRRQPERQRASWRGIAPGWVRHGARRPRVQARRRPPRPWCRAGRRRTRLPCGTAHRPRVARPHRCWARTARAASTAVPCRRALSAVWRPRCCVFGMVSDGEGKWAVERAGCAPPHEQLAVLRDCSCACCPAGNLPHADPLQGLHKPGCAAVLAKPVAQLTAVGRAPGVHAARGAEQRAVEGAEAHSCGRNAFGPSKQGRHQRLGVPCIGTSPDSQWHSPVALRGAQPGDRRRRVMAPEQHLVRQSSARQMRGWRSPGGAACDSGAQAAEPDFVLLSPLLLSTRRQHSLHHCRQGARRKCSRAADTHLADEVQRPLCVVVAIDDRE